MTRIDVLLAAYQGQRWLPEQLASLRAQDDACFRVLMQDDGSTDRTPELLREAAAQDERFVLAAEPGCHFGAAGNFLSLMRQSDASYVALCDQDDVWLPQRLSACRTAMQQAEAQYGATTPLLVHSDCLLTDAEGKQTHASFFAHQGWDPAATPLPRLLVQNNVTGCTILMNAALCDLVCAHADAAQLYMHDWYIALTAAACGHIVMLPQPLVRYRQHGHNAMGASAENQMQRGLRMLGAWQKGRDRIILTYDHTRMFRTSMADRLPEAALQQIDAYLATQQLPWLRRVMAVQRGGYTMQSVVTRVGQILFG